MRGTKRGVETPEKTECYCIVARWRIPVIRDNHTHKPETRTWIWYGGSCEDSEETLQHVDESGDSAGNGDGYSINYGLLSLREFNPKCSRKSQRGDCHCKFSGQMPRWSGPLFRKERFRYLHTEIPHATERGDGTVREQKQGYLSSSPKTERSNTKMLRTGCALEGARASRGRESVEKTRKKDAAKDSCITQTSLGYSKFSGQLSVVVGFRHV